MPRCWFAKSRGVVSPRELCGRYSLYSLRQASICIRASVNDWNQLALRHSPRKVPLNGSMKALSLGFQGLEKSKVTSFW